MGNNILPIDNREDHENPNLREYGISSSDSTFPAEIVAEIVKHLSPTERKQCERVSEFRIAAKMARDRKILNFLAGTKHSSKSAWSEEHNDIEISLHIHALTIIRSLLSRPGPYKKFLRFKSHYHDITDGQIMPIAHHNIQVLDLEMNTSCNDELALSTIISANDESDTIKYSCSREFAVEPFLPRNPKSIHLDACGISEEDEKRQKNIIPLINQSESLATFSMRFFATSYVMQALCECKKLQVLSLYIPFDPMLVFGVIMMNQLKRLKINFYMTCTLSPPLDLHFVYGLLKLCQSLEILEGSRRDIIEWVNTIAYLSELVTLDIMVDDVDEFHSIRLTKIRNFVLRKYGNDLPETGLITMVLNFKQLHLFASYYTDIPADVIEKFRDELGRCSRAIILMVRPKRVKILSMVCEKSIIRIKGIDGSSECERSATVV